MANLSNINNKFLVTTGGNVGIGTTSPGEKLEVAGNVGVNGFITHNGDSGTFMGWSADDTNVFYTAGNERLRINSSGNVGIGTASPTNIIHISTSSNAVGRFESTDGVAYIRINDTSDSFYLVTASQKGSIGGNADVNANNLNIDLTNGNVGIGTTSPAALLNLSQAAGANIRFDNETTTNYFTIGEGVGTNNIFSFRGNSYRSTDTLSIDFANDRVGIGTISPADKLTVNGNIITQGGNTNTGYDRYLKLYGNSDPATNSHRWAGLAVYNNGGNNVNELAFFAGTGDSTRTEKMRIDSSGKVGIGVTNPNEKLQLAGNLNAYDPSGIDAGLFASTAAGSTTIALRSNGITHFNGGNVGIGTTSPLAPLSVVTPAVAGIDLTNISRTANNLVRFTNPQYSTSASMGLLLRVFPDSDARQGAGLLMTGGSDNAASNLSLFVSKDDGTSSNVSKSYSALHIAGNTGNVGIGTTSPGAKLEIKGTGATSGLAFKTTDSSSNETFYIKDGGTVGVRYYPFKIGVPSGTANVANTRFQIATTGGDFVVLNDGKTGIGTTAPGARLHNYSTATQNVWISGYGTLAQNNWGAGHAIFAAQDNGLLISKANSANNTNRLFVFYHDSGGNGEQYIYDTNSTVKVKLDSAGDSYFNGGNVGIGTTSPDAKLHIQGSSSEQKVLEISTAQSDGPYTAYKNTSSGTTTLGFIGNSQGIMNSGNTNFGIRANNDLTFSSGGATERMRITSGGNVGIGTTAPAAALDIKHASAPLITRSTNNNAIAMFNEISGGYSHLYLYQINAGARVVISTNGDSYFNGGDFGIGTTSPTYKLHVKSSNNVSIFEDTSDASGAAFIVFNRPGVFSMGSITRNGSANSVSYNTGSDYRLKEDLKDFNALDLVNNITAYDYKWKDVDQRDYGFIAHELKQTLPNVVTGEKDGEKMQGVDYSKLTPILLKAIQELEARVKELENK